MSKKNCTTTDCRPTGASCPSRREFVVAGGLTTATLLLTDVFSERVRAEDAQREVRFARLHRQQIAKLSQLKTDQPIEFEYPADQPHSSAMLIKLGKLAGGGIGPDGDVVAFSTICTHMGDNLSYNADHKIAGPCNAHLTSFDLSRHGMVVAGHATSPLPQIVLELEEDAIFATGIVGLLYGHHSNPTA